MRKFKDSILWLVAIMIAIFVGAVSGGVIYLTINMATERKQFEVIHNNRNDTTIVEADHFTLQSPMMGQQAFFFNGERCTTTIDSVNEIVTINH